jgi:hypothetical protein
MTANGTAATINMLGGDLNDLGLGDSTGALEFATLNFVTSGANSSIVRIVDGAGGAVAAVSTINVTGTQRLTIDSVLTGVTTINGSANTGGTRVVIDTGANVAFTGGTGNDRVDIGTVGLSNADVLAGGTGTRAALPHSRIMIHQVSSGFRGTSADMRIQVTETNKLEDQLFQILSDKTGKTKKQIAKDCDRDYYMSPTEALDYGIIDQVVESKKNGKNS